MTGRLPADLAVVWRELRQMRSALPGLAGGSTNREALFHAAIEQSEQLFRGAEQADYAVRPLLLFYGLSQAGRAIAATMVSDNGGKLFGHGLKSGALGSPLHELSFEPLKTGAFKVLNVALTGAGWTEASTVGAVWSAIPELSEQPLPGEVHPPALSLYEENRYVGSGVAVDGLPTEVLPPLLPDQSPEWPHVADEAAVDAYLRAHYPSLRDLRYAPPGDSRTTTYMGPRTVRAHRTLDDADGVRRQFWEVTPALGRRYLGIGVGDFWAFPDVGASGVAPHPIMLWWALLYALSMRARYEPQAWLHDLDVNSNPHAVSLERALDIAVSVPPELVAELLGSLDATGKP